MIREINDLVHQYQRLTDGLINQDKYTYYAITYHSTAIEGSTLTEKQTINLLEFGQTAGNRPIEHHLMVLDHNHALDFILKAANAPQPITIEFIQSVGALVKKSTGSVVNTIMGTYDTSKGDLRLSGVRAGNRLFPDYKKVASLMKSLCQSINEDMTHVSTFEEICNLAFMVHYDFVSIHPFGDGNGRTSRLLMNYIQHRFKLPLSIVYKQDRAKYIAALENARSKEDITIFYNFMYSQYAKFLKSEIKFLTTPQ
jgi:Fic family protein